MRVGSLHFEELKAGIFVITWLQELGLEGKT